ncbi:hypothetical protein LQ384_29145, partial [Rhodococcus rhodochrous]|nr:hypothetical protein [Rhodococcus rhodochrous]
MTTVEVFIDDKGGVRPVGQAHFTRNRGQISTTFLYDPRYLSGDGMSIDPALPLMAGLATPEQPRASLRRQRSEPVGA